MPVGCPGNSHRIIWLNLQRALDQFAGLLEFPALHAVNEWNGEEQHPGRSVALLSSRLAFDKQNDRVDACDDATGDHFVQSMQFAKRQFEPIAPDRLTGLREIEQADADLQILPASAYDAVNRIIQLLTLKDV